MTTAETSPSPPKPSILKFALELGPLAVFFLANRLTDEGPAIAVFLFAVLVSLVLSRVLIRHWPVVPLIAAVVTAATGIPAILYDESWMFQLKPTVTNLILAAALFGGLWFGKLLLPMVLDSVLALTNEGWRKLTIRWAALFLVLAVVNEIVRLNFSYQFWADFKVFGMFPITLVFAMAQVPLLQRYAVKPADAPAE